MDGWPEGRVHDSVATVNVVQAPEWKRQLVSSRLIKTLPIEGANYFTPIAFARDGRTLLGYSERGGASLDIEGGRFSINVPWPSEPRAYQVKLSPKQSTYYVARMGTRTEQVVKDGITTPYHHQIGGLEAYDVATGAKLQLFEGREPSSVYGVSVSPDENWLGFCEVGSGSAGPNDAAWRTVLLDLRSNRETIVESCFSIPIFTPEMSHVFLADYNRSKGSSTLYRLDFPELNSTILEAEDNTAIVSPDISSDGRWMIRRRQPLDDSQPMEVELWNRASEQVVWKAKHSINSVTYAIFSPDSRRVALVDCGSGVRFFDLETQAETMAFAPPTATVELWDPKFSPDGTKFALIASGLNNDSPRSTDPEDYDQPALWLADMTDPTNPEQVTLPPGRAWLFVWTPDGKAVAIRSTAGYWIVNCS